MISDQATCNDVQGSYLYAVMINSFISWHKPIYPLSSVLMSVSACVGCLDVRGHIEGDVCNCSYLGW